MSPLSGVSQHLGFQGRRPGSDEMKAGALFHLRLLTDSFPSLRPRLEGSDVLTERQLTGTLDQPRSRGRSAQGGTGRTPPSREGGAAGPPAHREWHPWAPGLAGLEPTPMTPDHGAS